MKQPKSEFELALEDTIKRLFLVEQEYKKHRRIQDDLSKGILKRANNDPETFADPIRKMAMAASKEDKLQIMYFINRVVEMQTNHINLLNSIASILGLDESLIGG